jgi:hypothetical protein
MFRVFNIPPLAHAAMAHRANAEGFEADADEEDVADVADERRRRYVGQYLRMHGLAPAGREFLEYLRDVVDLIRLGQQRFVMWYIWDVLGSGHVIGFDCRGTKLAAFDANYGEFEFSHPALWWSWFNEVVCRQVGRSGRVRSSYYAALNDHDSKVEEFALPAPAPVPPRRAGGALATPKI